jgi:hypothetical protein
VSLVALLVTSALQFAFSAQWGKAPGSRVGRLQHHPLRSGWAFTDIVLALDGSRVVGVLTGLNQGKHIMCGLPSRPQICVDPTCDRNGFRELLSGLLVEARFAATVNIFTWGWMNLPLFKAHGFRTKTFPGNVVLDLKRGADTLFGQFRKDRRRNIRFAEKNGVEVSEATTPQDIADALEIYKAWHHTDRKMITHNRTPEQFQRAARLTSNRRVFVAKFSGKPIAMNIFRFYPGGLFESAANSSLDEFLYLKPNDLLQWRGIQWACKHGLALHSLGGSSDFLLRFGGSLVPTVRYRLDKTLFRKYDLHDRILESTHRTVQRLEPVLRRLRSVTKTAVSAKDREELAGD